MAFKDRNDVVDRPKPVDNSKPKPTEKMREYVAEYRRFSKAVAWMARNTSAGLDVSAEVPRFMRLESWIDRHWLRFSKDERAAIMFRLVDDGFFPEACKEIYREFNGEVVCINGKD